MNESHQYQRTMQLALEGDESAWQYTLREARRRGDRGSQLQLLRIRADAEGHSWDVPRVLTAPVWHSIPLCWDQRIAVRYAADCAERALHSFESRYPGDIRPREAIQAARAWILEPTEDRRKQVKAAADAAWGAAKGAAWGADAAASAAANVARAVTSATAAADVALAAALAAAVYAAAWTAADAAAERSWQRKRLTEYLLGAAVPC